MWSSKMAARWRGKDGLLNAANRDFLDPNNTNELTPSRADVVDVDRSQSCMDHSILAIFEDSTVASENKSGVDEESETLLSALTEMLDTVEDDDTLSPFDTLPDTKLLIDPGRRGSSAIMSFAERLRPRPKSPSVTVTIKGDGEKGDEKKMERHSFSQLFKQQSHTENKKAENEEQVLTSTSIVNLVKLMHSYCLKLYVDEGKKNHSVISQGEVWRYEKPTEESDEEINVVSDDEAPVNKTKEEKQGDGKRDNGKLLKSVLVNGNSSRAPPPSREKKRVSFGPVQVASFDESVEKGLNKKNLTSGHTSETVSVSLDRTKALENPSGPTLEPQTPSSETNCGRAAVVLLKGETKVKSLSLQQYRQLRQKRQPLVEKQGNYTTKWPSVSEPPKELPPILCLQAQNSCGQNTVDHCPEGNRITTDHLHKPGYKTSSHHTIFPPRPRPKLSEAKPSTHLHHSRLKLQRTQTRIISPASPLPDVTGNMNVIVPGSKKSPVKKPTMLSSDPPNPVLLPMPVSHTIPPPGDHSLSEPKADSNLQNIRHENQNESSTTTPQRQVLLSEPKIQVLLLNQDSTALLQESKDKFTEIASDICSTPPAPCPSTIQTESASQCRKLQPQKCSLSPVKETKQEPKTPHSQRSEPESQIKCPPPAPFSAHPPCPVVAPILVREKLPEARPGVSPHEEPPPALQRGCTVQDTAGDSGIEAPDLTSLLEQFEETQAKESMCESESKPKSVSIDLNQQRTAPVGSENTSRLALEPLSTSETPRKLPDLQMLERVDIPEAISTEIILSTQQEQPARRRNPSSKAIQIIDARPLPSKKILTSPSESPATNTSSHLTLSVFSDHDYCGPVDRLLTSAAQRSRAKPSLLKDILQTISELQVSSYDSSAAAECKTQTSSGQEKSLSAQPEARSETGLSPDKTLQFSDRVAEDGVICEHKTAQCTLPTPPPSPPSRGREKRRYRRMSDSSTSSRSSSSSSASSSSASRSPKRRKLCHKCSESSSCSSSCSRSVSRSPPRHNRSSYSRLRPSRSRSRSWSASRSRSPSPEIYHRQWRNVYSSRESRRLRRECEMRIQKLKAIDERRVVYVGRICRSMTHSELRERFSQFGEVECVSLHFRDRGDHYAFVTFYNMENAFAAIDNGGKLRKPDELPFDICFGGRRQFCNSDYSDLDANREADLSPAKSRFEDLDFDSLLKQAQRGLKR